MASDAVVKDLVTANHVLANEGFLAAFGHVSARDPTDPETMLISAYQSPALAEADDLVQMSLDGDLLTEGVDDIYSENVIHRAIYRHRPDVNAVVHGHPDAVIPFCVTDLEIKPVTHQGTPFNDGVPTFEAYDEHRGRMIVTEEEGDRMASELGECRAQLLKQHGANVVGRTVREATMLATFLMSNASQQLEATGIGEPEYFTEPAAEIRATVEGTVLKSRTIDRAWDYLVHQLPG